MGLVAFLCSFSAHAGSVVDAFDRADTSYSSWSEAIGENWVNPNTQNKWRIKGENLFVSIKKDPAILYNKQAVTVCGNGKKYVLTADVVANVSLGWAGVVFHYKDALNFYVFRFKSESSSYQILRIVNGKTGLVLMKEDAIKPFKTGVAYRLTVMSEEPYTFNVKITEPDGADTLNPVTLAMDSNQNFADGYAGVYSPTTSGTVDPDAVFDNFNCEMAP